MEKELTQHLLCLCDRYAVAQKLKKSTIGRLCAADTRFFSRLQNGKTFTAKKYDAVVQWFSDHWPADVAWPDEVIRPEPQKTKRSAMPELVENE